MVGDSAPARRLQVDEAPWWNKAGIVAYVDSILRRTPDSPYPSAGRQKTMQVARSLADRVGRSFLLARLAAESLAHRISIVDVEDLHGQSSLEELLSTTRARVEESAASRGGEGCVWDLSAGQPLQVLSGHTGDVTAVVTAVLPDGRVVAVTGSTDGALEVWDLTTGTPGPPLSEHGVGVTAMATAVLPDGRVVAVTGSTDRTIRTWDLSTGQPLQAPTGHTSRVTAVATAVLPDGRTIAVTGAQGRQRAIRSD